MNQMPRLLALAGLGDVSGVIFLIMFSVWPFHISSALGITTTLTLHGYGATAVCFQCVMLILFVTVTVYRIRKPTVRSLSKILWVVIGYPFILLLTNLLPSFL